MIRLLIKITDQALYVAGLATVVARELLPKEPEPVVLITGELPASLLREVMSVTRPGGTS